MLAFESSNSSRRVCWRNSIQRRPEMRFHQVWANWAGFPYTIGLFRLHYSPPLVMFRYYICIWWEPFGIQMSINWMKGSTYFARFWRNVLRLGLFLRHLHEYISAIRCGKYKSLAFVTFRHLTFRLIYFRVTFVCGRVAQFFTHRIRIWTRVSMFHASWC